MEERENYRALLEAAPSKGIKLKRHLRSKLHNFGEKEAGMRESFINHKIKHMCQISKHEKTKPLLCTNCKICVDRIDIHLNVYHQLRRRSEELYREIHKYQKFTIEFEKQVFLSESKNNHDNDEDIDNDEDSDKQPPQDNSKKVKLSQKTSASSTK